MDAAERTPPQGPRPPRAPAGITNEVPPATVKGLPSLSLNGTAESFSVYEYGRKG